MTTSIQAKQFQPVLVSDKRMYIQFVADIDMDFLSPAISLIESSFLLKLENSVYNLKNTLTKQKPAKNFQAWVFVFAGNPSLPLHSQKSKGKFLYIRRPKP